MNYAIRYAQAPQAVLDVLVADFLSELVSELQPHTPSDRPRDCLGHEHRLFVSAVANN